jgi:hypothetical protein
MRQLKAAARIHHVPAHPWLCRRIAITYGVEDNSMRLRQRWRRLVETQETCLADCDLPPGLPKSGTGSAGPVVLVTLGKSVKPLRVAQDDPLPASFDEPLALPGA